MDADRGMRSRSRMVTSTSSGKAGGNECSLARKTWTSFVNGCLSPAALTNVERIVLMSVRCFLLQIEPVVNKLPSNFR